MTNEIEEALIVAQKALSPGTPGFMNAYTTIAAILTKFKFGKLVVVDKKRLMKHLYCCQKWQEFHRCTYPKGFDFRGVPREKRVRRHLAYLQRREEKSDEN